VSEPLSQAIDQSGLSTTYTSGVTNFQTYVAGAPTHTNTGAAGTTDFIGSASSAADVSTRVITFDLGELLVVEEIAFWSFFLGSTAPQITSVDIEASQDASFTTPVSLGTFTPAATFSATQPVQVYDAFAATVAQFIRFVNIDTSSSSVAFGEVAFGATAVPEARAWLMMSAILVGAIGTIGVRKLRQNRVAALAQL
jgi:hypothetical protein